MRNTIEAIGLTPHDKALIITAEGYGSSHAANSAIASALAIGSISNFTLQVPCPWARYAGDESQDCGIGIAITCVAEHSHYRWGPITLSPSLLDGDGGFPSTIMDLSEHADLDELAREGRSQIERAMLWGIEPTNLASHLDALIARAEFFDIYLELASEYDLPISLPDPSINLGYPAHNLAKQKGLLAPDFVIKSTQSSITETLAELKPGVTELRFRPAFDTAELRAITPQWRYYSDDADKLCDNENFRAAIEQSEVHLISYRELMTAQRKLSKP